MKVGDLVKCNFSQLDGTTWEMFNDVPGLIISHYPEVGTESYEKDGARAVKILFIDKGITKCVLAKHVEVISETS